MLPAQCRGARAMLGWSQTTLAKEAGVGLSTVLDFERGTRTPIPNNLTAIRRVLEAAGVKFIADGKSGGPGVRLGKPEGSSCGDVMRRARLGKHQGN